MYKPSLVVAGAMATTTADVKLIDGQNAPRIGGVQRAVWHLHQELARGRQAANDDYSGGSAGCTRGVQGGCCGAPATGRLPKVSWSPSGAPPPSSTGRRTKSARE